MTRPRALDWLLIVAVTASWAVLFGRGVAEGLRTERGALRVVVSSAPANDDYPDVIWSEPKQLEPGDELVAVDGEDLRGSSALRFNDRATQAARERGFASIRANRAGTPIDVRLGLTPSVWWWAVVFPPAAVLLTAIILLVRAPDWHLARRFLVASWCFAAADAVMDWRSTIQGTVFEATLIPGLLALGSGLLVWNAQEFTLSARPVPRLHRAFAITAVAGVITNYGVILFVPYTLVVHRMIIAVTHGWVIAASLAGLSRCYRRSDSGERRLTRWLLLGTYVTLAGSFVITVANLASAPTLVRVTLALLGLGMPIGIVVAVIGYRWLDVDRLISAAASYTIVGLAVLGGALAITPRLALAAAPAVGIDPAIAQWLLTMALVAAAIPAHRFLWPRIDQRMFAERHQRTLGFERLLDEIGGYAKVEELVRLAAERIDALLEPESIAVYARDGASIAPVFVRGRPAPPVIEADSVLVRALERRPRPLSADAAELDAFDRAALETLGVTLVVPTRGRDGVVAFACLGPKRSGDIYLPDEIAQLGAVADRCSEVLLRLVEERLATGNGDPLPHIFRRDGEFWTIASAGKEIRLRDMRGLHYLATLLREPGREFHASDLVGTAGTGFSTHAAAGDPSLAVVGGLGDAGAPIDARAQAAYRERLRALDEEQAEAERNSDLGSLGVLAAEREALLTELEGVARGRRAASRPERARVAVTKAIKAALEKIAERHPELGAHLSATIRRGYACAYVPDPRVPVEWEI